MIPSEELFQPYGVHCVVDGQFGSTGKGALSAWLARQAIDSKVAGQFGGCIYSGGPNSGHTFYNNGSKHVLKQLPTFAVYLYLNGYGTSVYLSAGAVIDRKILREEVNRFPGLPVYVHPNAAIITEDDKNLELTGTVAEVAGTRSGTGAAIARKVLRDPMAVAGNSLGYIARNVKILDHPLVPMRVPYFMEVSQGYSLGINSQFYPKVTSRECTVMQGLADARVPARLLARTYMAIRTYPIRVGNVDGYSSGDWYPDQVEASWEELGVEPELTTVTQRVRRVATFSMIQFLDAAYANLPDLVFISHMDYLKEERQAQFKKTMEETRSALKAKYALLYGYGPKVEDIRS